MKAIDFVVCYISQGPYDDHTYCHNTASHRGKINLSSQYTECQSTSVTNFFTPFINTMYVTEGEMYHKCEKSFRLEQ